MRQQGVNQFDKGLNLDTNPITVDNHTLTGALNATMITMNGNELVLQNDMGNGRVDQAQLPEGYVPVGMQEYGGIVYVASYNPLEEKSQIGCFPSPQRNIPSSENGSNKELQALQSFINDKGYIEKISERILLIGDNDIIRPGDKFLITTSDINNYDSNYITLRVLVVNEDGSSIDITDDLTANNNGTTFPFLYNMENVNEEDYSVYKNKTPGKIYLEAQLIIPAYINTVISASKNDNNEVTLTITPSAYDLPDGETEVPWDKNSLSYYLEYSKNGQQAIPCDINNGKFIISELHESDRLSYTIYPVYTYTENGPKGKVVSLKRENSINIGEIGNGEVEFTTFRYYNNIASGTFVFDYGINAHIDTFEGQENYQLKEFYIEYYSVEDVINNTANIAKRINLNTNNYFGVYTTIIPYNADFNLGEHYIARLCTVVGFSSNSNNDKTTYSKWYSVITSSITNQLYLETFENMIEIENVEPKIFKLDCQSEISRELINEGQSEVTVPGSNITPVLTESPFNSFSPEEQQSTIQNFRIKNETRKTGNIRYKHIITTKVLQSRDNNDNIKLPYNITARTTPEYIVDPVCNAIINTFGTLNDNTVSGFDNSTISNTAPSGTDHINSVWYSLNNNEVTLNYILYSQYFAKLLKASGIGDSVDDYKFIITTTASAFLPYTPSYQQTLTGQLQLENILGPLVNIQTNNGKITDLSTYHLTYTLSTLNWDLRNNSNKYVGIYTGAYAQAGFPPTDNSLWNEVFISEISPISQLPQWSNISSSITGVFSNTLRLQSQPAILMWVSTGDYHSALYPLYFGGEEDRIFDYSIPLMPDSTGTYYVLNQFMKHCQMIIPIEECFNEIYLCQPDQEMTFNYWIGSTEDYIYTKPYQLTTNYKVRVTSNPIPRIDGYYDDYNVLNNNSITFDNKNLYLPKFRLKIYSKEQEYSDTFSSPDQSVRNSQFLSMTTAPTFDTCAIILDSTGKHFVRNAYTSDGEAIGFNPNHVYIRKNGYGSNTQLMDIENNDLTSVTESYGYYIAKALKELKLKVSNDSERKIIVVNPSRCSKVEATNYWLGEAFNANDYDHNRSARQKLEQIARNYILDLQLFCSDENDDTYLFKRFNYPYHSAGWHRVPEL